MSRSMARRLQVLCLGLLPHTHQLLPWNPYLGLRGPLQRIPLVRPPPQFRALAGLLRPHIHQRLPLTLVGRAQLADMATQAPPGALDTRRLPVQSQADTVV